jgi:hypothetical protein
MKFSYHPDDSVTAYSHFALTESALKDLVDVLFVMNWSQITVGPCIEGGRFVQAPGVRILDSSLTVDLGAWHFYRCIGQHNWGRRPRS